MSSQAGYIPAFRLHILTPLFDPMMRWVMRELTFKGRLVVEAQIADGLRVLDLGSGTGTLTILIKKLHPHAQVTGIDPDPAILDIARTKAKRQDVNIAFDEGLATALPYGARSFDRVLSSLVFHHLTTEDKAHALQEVLRVLKPGGRLLIADFGKPQNALAWVIAKIMQQLEPTRDLNQGLLPEMLRQVGFQRVEIIAQFMTVFGTLAIYRGEKP